MATDFNPTFQTKYHEVVVPKLLQVLEDNDNPRVQAHVAAALVNFSESHCMSLVCYARELKEGFGDYVDQVSELMIPLLKLYFHDGVRSAATECLSF